MQATFSIDPFEDLVMTKMWKFLRIPLAVKCIEPVRNSSFASRIPFLSLRIEAYENISFCFGLLTLVSYVQKNVPEFS